MERQAIASNTALPGYDTLTNISHDTRDVFVADDTTPYRVAYNHMVYLDNPTYSKYLKMNKVLVGNKGAGELIDIGDALATESLPRYLDTAGWAYAEASLAGNDLSATRKVELVQQAEECWSYALRSYKHLESGEESEWFVEDPTEFRLAINLAYAPLLKSLAIGNVTDAVRERTFADTLAIAQLAAVHMELAVKEADQESISAFSGFLHECNALLAFLYMDDPRYIPLPSSARADSGYYHPEQAHDITLLNQHWGRIKNVIPIEIKAAASANDRRRYKALIIRGKMHLHLGMNGNHDPRQTLDAFADMYEDEGAASRSAYLTVMTVAATAKRLVSLYRSGHELADLSLRGVTHFHDKERVVTEYPELSPSSRR